jgi:hypothetical protein
VRSKAWIFLFLGFLFSAPAWAEDGFSGVWADTGSVIIWYMGKHDGFSAVFVDTSPASAPFAIGVSTDDPNALPYFSMKTTDFMTIQGTEQSIDMFGATALSPQATYWSQIFPAFQVEVDLKKSAPARSLRVR